MVNLEWYRTFKCVYDCESLTKASQKLYMSQPGVSKQIAALEADVGQQLFERTPRKLLPTEYGKFLYTQVAGYVEGLENAEQKFRRGSNKKCPSIVVGCTSDFFREYLLDKLSDINMYITFKFGETDKLKEYLEKDKIHLIVTDERYTDFDHNFSLIFEHELGLFASEDVCRNFPYKMITETNKKEVQKWLSSQLWYAYDNDLSFIKTFWKENFNSRPQLMAKYVFPSLKDIVLSLETSNGISVLPNYISYDAVKKGTLRPLLANAKKPVYQLFWTNKKTTDYYYEINVFIEKLNLK